MFERFTGNARSVVKAAYVEARHDAAPSVGTEHLLAALLEAEDCLALTVLDGFGVDRRRLRADLRPHGPGTWPEPTATDRGTAPAADAHPEDADPSHAPPTDAEALASLGIDLDEVRRQADEAFGAGALDRTWAARARRGGSARRLPLDRTARKAIELSLREAIRMRHNYIGTEHLLLALLFPGTGPAQRLLAGHGVRLDPARTIVEELVRARRAG